MITEKVLLDNYSGVGQVGDLLSDINGECVVWNYRRTHDEGSAVCDRDRADSISLEYDRVGTISLSPENDDHPALAKIAHDLARLYGPVTDEA